jgi:hypothetical protein
MAVEVVPAVRVPIRLRAGPELNLGNTMPRLLKRVGCLSFLVFFPAAGWAIHFLGLSVGFLVAGIAVTCLAAGIVYLWLQALGRLSQVAVEVSEFPLQAGRNHALEIWHADPKALRDVRLQLVCREQRGQGKTGRLKVSRCPPVPLTAPAHPGGAWKGRLEIPHTAASFALCHDRYSPEKDVYDELDLDDQVSWHLELRPRRWRPWVARYPVEIRGPASDSTSTDPAQPDAAPTPTRLQGEDLSVWINGDQAVLAPRAVLTGGFQRHALKESGPLRRIELSVVCVTGPGGCGWGKTELDVCHFEEYEAGADDGAALLGPQRFRAILPDGPPSYCGQLFQVTWAVRVRLCYRDGKESVRDLPFRLLAGDGEQTVGNLAEVAGSAE